MSQKALISLNPYDTEYVNKYIVYAYGSHSYIPNQSQQVVDLTDWPYLSDEKCIKEDVYYSDTPDNGKYFICKYTNTTEREEHYKKKKIYDIATSIIQNIAYAVKTMYEMQSTKGVTTTLTTAEYELFLDWTEELATKHKTFDVSTITIDDIYEGNTSIFPTIPVDPQLNGY